MKNNVWHSIKCKRGKRRNFGRRLNRMKRQLQGLALILLSILLMLGYGNISVFDLDFKWSLFFTVLGMIGTVVTFLPNKE